MSADFLNEPKTAQVNLRLPPTLKALAEKRAKRERRSLTSLIEFLLVEYLENVGDLAPEDAAEQAAPAAAEPVEQPAPAPKPKARAKKAQQE